MRLLLLLFVVVPFVELFLLLQIAEWTSGLFTFGLVVLTGIVGAALARLQGFHVLARIRNDLRQGKIPTTSLLDALMVLVAGALLITPGVLTDVFGFSLLIPYFRSIYRSQLTRWFRKNAHFEAVVGGTVHRRQRVGDEVIDSFVVGRSDSDDSPDETERLT